MSNNPKLSVNLATDYEIQCPEILIQRSNLLTCICTINDNSCKPVQMPGFVTEQIILDIISILQNGTFIRFVNLSLDYSMKVVKTLDFLAICDEYEMLLSSICDMVTSENSFQIFSMAKQLPCFEKLTVKCFSLMKRDLDEFYTKSGLFDYRKDPFISEYSSFTIFDIEYFINACDKYSTVIKIVILQNWLDKNKTWLSTERIMNILETINSEASYIPRYQIKFMRNIRNQLLTEIKQINETKVCKMT